MNKKIKIMFNILAVFGILIFCFAITPRTLQNDTYYTIKIGEYIMENGIDMMDPFSWHEDLPYTYPHWAYDVATYMVYNWGENVGIGGFTSIYISTVILCMILGVTLYTAITKVSKNNLISFFVTLGVIYLLKSFIAARAQLVTYILFVLTILFIEKFIETKKKRYAIGLIIIPIIIANVHLAVWPFYFVLYLPYIAEYIIAAITSSNLYYNIAIKINKNKVKKLSLKNAEKNKEKIEVITRKIDELQDDLANAIRRKDEKKLEPYKIIVEKHKIVKWLIVIMIICAFTGMLTPLGDTPYTYLVKTMQGNTMQSISEHLPLTLIENKPIMVVLVLFLAILIFTDTKIKLRDLFMIAGLVLLTFMSRRQASMLVLVGSFIFAKLCASFAQKYDPEGSLKLEKAMTTILGKIITILIVVLMSFVIYKPKMKSPIVSSTSYPVEAANYILENLDINTMRLYNEYNYGSYLLFRGIPVFIDSRADLYAPEFNGVKNSEGKYEGRDIFSDYINISGITTYYEDKFEQYEITHVITKKSSKLNMFISRDENYKRLYTDDRFVIYERLAN